MIIARPARLLECLEFDPEEFYNQMVDMEGEVRTMQMVQRMNLYGQQTQQPQQPQQQIGTPTFSVHDTGKNDGLDYEIGSIIDDLLTTLITTD